MPFINNPSLGPVSPSSPLIPNKPELSGNQSGSGAPALPGAEHPQPVPVSPLPQRASLGKPDDGSVFHGARSLKKKDFIEEVAEVAHDISKHGMAERKKYGIAGTGKYGMKKFARQLTESLPNQISTSTIEPYELKKGLKSAEKKFVKDSSDTRYNSEELKEDKRRVSILKRLLGK